MCGICGCNEADLDGRQDGASAHAHAATHDHPHLHEHHAPHSHPHTHAPADETHAARRVRLEEDLLRKNALLAERNRGWFSGRRAFAVNFVSSPGSGKTTLLEQTVRRAAFGASIRVIQGDQATDRDAERVRRAGARAVQINTGTGCHLDAAMVSRGALELDPDPNSLVAIENVGNLVCPALFDLGEHARIALISVTEGADKPLKYPYLFRGSQLIVVNKTDLLPYVDFDIGECTAALRQVNPDASLVTMSAKTGEGLDGFFGWIIRRAALASIELARGAEP